MHRERSFLLIQRKDYKMEIERKFLLEQPPQVAGCASKLIEQAYLCTDPVVRIRKEDDAYYMTYKGGGMMVREEYNLPLNEKAYAHLLQKADGCILTKRRYLIPLSGGLTAEIDQFFGKYEGLWLAEVEFSSAEDAQAFIPPRWFGREVTYDRRYHNSNMSKGGSADGQQE